MIDTKKRDETMINTEKTISLLNRLSHYDAYHEPHTDVNIASVILTEIERCEFFKTNPQFYGRVLIDSDANRSIVWALSSSVNTKTVVLLNEHDAFIQSHSDLNHEDALSGDWFFGSGENSGLATSLPLLERATLEEFGVNILLISAPKGNLSSNCQKQLKELLISLESTFKLNYEMGITTTPQSRNHLDEFAIGTGSAGKVMPLVVSKGMPVYSSSAYSGINSISIAMEIIKAVELNTEMGDCLDGKMTPPPTFLDLYSIRDNMGKVIPEYTIGSFNWLFLKNRIQDRFEQLRELCKWSLEDAINQFNYSYNEYLRKQGLPSYRECMAFDFEILFLDELESRVSQTVDLGNLFVQIQDANPKASSQELVAKYVVNLIERANYKHPVVVIALWQPFDPPVESHAYFDAKLKSTMIHHFNENGKKMTIDSYQMGASSFNHLKKTGFDVSATDKWIPSGLMQTHSNYVENAKLDLDILHIGPWVKDLHQKFERVYLKDLTETLPDIYDRIIRTVGRTE